MRCWSELAVNLLPIRVTRRCSRGSRTRFPLLWICRNSSYRIAASSLNSLWNHSSIFHAIFGGPH
jgi:hypothetical protein